MEITTPALGQETNRLTAVRPAARPWYADALRHKEIGLGGGMFLVILLTAVFAPLLANHNPDTIRPEIRLLGPSLHHYFGTDNLGRDLYSRTVFGARVSLLVGVSVAILSGLVGAAFGLLAGYYPRVDTVLMRIMDGMMAFPGIVLAVGIMAAMGAKVSNVIIALGVVYTPRVARVVRSLVLTISSMQCIDAARTVGMTDRRILLRHILPNCISPLIVQGTFIFSDAVLAEAALSFLGVGTPPYIPSWGIILGEARLYIRIAPWMMALPGLALTVTVLGLNLVGDGIRDWLDPRLRKSL